MGKKWKNKGMFLKDTKDCIQSQSLRERHGLTAVPGHPHLETQVDLGRPLPLLGPADSFQEMVWVLCRGRHTGLLLVD